MTFFHFTSTKHLPFIEADGFLRPTESNVGAPFPCKDGPSGLDVGPRVVWLLDIPEAGGDKDNGLMPMKREVRFEVDVPAIRWLDWAPARAMSDEWREVFVRAGGGPEFAEHWFVFPAPIRRRRWLDVRTGVALDA